MTISFSSGVVNKLLAPGIAQFVTCELPDIRPEYPESSHWLSNHFLNSAFRMQFGGSYRQYAINVLFRTQICFGLYHEAREGTLSYLDGNSSHNPRVGRYFALIARWEACLLNLQMFIDVFNKLNGETAFQQGDGSAEERAYGIANVVKHWGGHIRAGMNDGDDTIPLWISDTALHTRTKQLTFAELAQMMREIATVADELQDPGNFQSTELTEQRSSSD